MLQKALQSFESECGKAKIFVENDMGVGAFHDFLMKLKAEMVSRMQQAQKLQEEEVKSQEPAPQEEQPKAQDEVAS